ncbi:MAG: helix-turn-helix domain-containing protein [Gemmatimonadetes bacterium]|nr:helix-turn-helix domain-containing protein [Gemmatimonadota bacterium]
MHILWRSNRHGWRSLTEAVTWITWTEQTADELLDSARRYWEAKQASRARAMIMEGAARTEAAQAQGRNFQILHDWVLRYNAEGLDGLADRRRGGSEGWLTDAQTQLDGVHAPPAGIAMCQGDVS